jgi:hypothetical protein
MYFIASSFSEMVASQTNDGRGKGHRCGLARSAQSSSSFRVADLDVKELLLADDRGVFFTTPHFDGYPAVLMRIPATAGRRRTQPSSSAAWTARARRGRPSSSRRTH